MAPRTRRIATFAVVSLSAAAALGAAVDWYRAVPPDALAHATYVGRQSCVYCHQAEAEAFRGSDHDRAMEIADEQSVLGDFNDFTFKRFDETTRFFRDGKRYMVSAEGPDAKQHDYEVKYTFGIDPLQQYMVELPGGRLQVLRVSWDVKKKEWFFVAPDDAVDERLKADDPLHWTGLAQNWNTMCADCHSTNFHKNFNLAKDEYKSEYSEIDVSCEACHGPGSVHVAVAERRGLFWDRRVGYGLVNTLKGADNHVQLETCAPCHSRRSMLNDGYHAGDKFLDYFDPMLLESGLYHVDGQIQDEVYVYGSFTQSKMYAKGVKCTDCHNPHSGDVKFEGNKLCAQCHQPGKYDSPVHNHHPQAAAGDAVTQCITCHMPTRVYMGIDARHDHSIRVPRPDLSMETGAPNVCNRCHTSEQHNAAWAAKTIVQWYGPKRPDDPHPSRAFSAAERREPGADKLLAEVIERVATPEIVRASAVAKLGEISTDESRRVRREAVSNESALVRAAAVRSLADELVSGQVLEAGPRLRDKVRSVRLAAASRLVEIAGELSKSEYRIALDEAVAEYREAQDVYLDRAASHMNLARLARNLGEKKQEIGSLRMAIKLQPYLTGPRAELAVALENEGGDGKEIRQLRQEEADLLKRDAELLPGDPSPHYRRGMLLYLLGENGTAIDELTIALAFDKNDYQTLLALALLCEKEQRWEEAMAVLKRMSDLRPQADDWRGLYVRVREAMDKEKPEQKAAPEGGAKP